MNTEILSKSSTIGRTCDMDVKDGLTLENFIQIGIRGITDARNSYCQGMAWFKGKVYVGMTRDSLCLLKRKARKLRPPKTEFWPVKCPDTDTAELWRGQILCYDLLRDQWEKVYKSPLITVSGEKVTRDVGYRGMTVHQYPGDSEPSLYVDSMSGKGALILYFEDGMRFETTKARLGSATSIRSLISFKGKLFTAITGKSDHHPNESAHTEVFVSTDPKSGQWRAASYPGFGDQCNTAIFELGQFNDFLYAATMNPFGGCHLWRTKDGGRFYPITRNGFGTVYNMGIRQMVSTNYGLFVGTANPFGPEHCLSRQKQYHQALLKLGQQVQNWLYSSLTKNFYKDTGFHHIGYWKEDTANARQACENLLDKINEGKFNAVMTIISRIILFARYYVLVMATKKVIIKIKSRTNIKILF